MNVNVLKYAAVNTKIHALKSYLLTDSDYRELMAKGSVPEIVRYLAERWPYSERLQGLDPESVHRRDLEVLIRSRQVEVIGKLLFQFHDAGRKFILLLLQKYEIENLKLALRHALIAEPKYAQDISPKSYPLGVYATIDPVRLAACSGAEQLLEALQGSQYYEEVNSVIESQSQSKQNLVYLLETALDKWYISRIEQLSSKLGSEERKAVLQSIDVHVDLTNMEWIIRAKKFYSFTPEELYNSLIHAGYKLKADYLRLACDTKSTEEALQFLRAGPYAPVFADLHDGDSLPFELAQRLRRFFYRSTSSGSLAHEFSLAKLLEYVILVEYEIDDLVTITEAVRYSLQRDEIIRYLGRPLS